MHCALIKFDLLRKQPKSTCKVKFLAESHGSGQNLWSGSRGSMSTDSPPLPHPGKLSTVKHWIIIFNASSGDMRFTSKALAQFRQGTTETQQRELGDWPRSSVTGQCGCQTLVLDLVELSTGFTKVRSPYFLDWQSFSWRNFVVGLLIPLRIATIIVYRSILEGPSIARRLVDRLLIQISRSPWVSHVTIWYWIRISFLFCLRSPHASHSCWHDMCWVWHCYFYRKI